MILSFKKQFKTPILDGVKIHTIREDTKDRWKPGNTIHFATGRRTKHYEQFKEGECISTQKIEIRHWPDYKTDVLIDGHFFGEVLHKGLDEIYIYHADLLILAMNDGFTSIEDFFQWFSEDFTGKIIHWTNFKY